MPIPTSPEPADVRLSWRKSSYSGGGNNCVEVAEIASGRAVRDSKNPDGGHLTFGVGAWQAFLTDIKRGRYSF
jgi:Domain of unknown function (DUF397)